MPASIVWILSNTSAYRVPLAFHKRVDLDNKYVYALNHWSLVSVVLAFCHFLSMANGQGWCRTAGRNNYMVLAGSAANNISSTALRMVLTTYFWVQQKCLKKLQAGEKEA